MAKNTYTIDQYKHSGYWVEFDSKGCFFIGNRFGRSCITFGVDMGSYVHVDYKKKRYLTSWRRSYSRIRWHCINCRKKALKQFY